MRAKLIGLAPMRIGGPRSSGVVGRATRQGRIGTAHESTQIIGQARSVKVIQFGASRSQIKRGRYASRAGVLVGGVVELAHTDTSAKGQGAALNPDMSPFNTSKFDG